MRVNYTAKKSKYKHLLEGLFLFRNIPQEVVDAVYNSPACECVEFFPVKWCSPKINIAEALDSLFPENCGPQKTERIP